MSPSAIIMDMDTTTTSSLVIRIPSLSAGDNYTFPDAPPLNKTMESNSSSRIITYSGTQLTQFYVDLMRSFQYRNTLDEPVTGIRIATIQVYTPADAPGQTIGSNVARVSIEVLPLNDKAPMFTESIYTGTITENAPAGTPIGVTVAATDGDTYGSAIITFASSDSFFSVDPFTGIVSSRAPLNAEGSTPYELTIMASDNDGPTSLTSSVIVLVNVTDLNDNPPVFNQTSYLISTREDASIGATILRVSATDADISEANSGIRYFISNSDTQGSGSGTGPITPTDSSNIQGLPFDISTTTGDITVSGQLDFDAGTTLYDFSVLAIDSGSSPLMGSAAVRIRITDANDNAPQFINTPFSFIVPENSPPTPVVSIMARDVDTGANGQIQFSLLGTSIFSINPTTGLLSLTGALDFEMNRTHTFTVVATDLGSPSLNSQETITITVQNVNDNPPVFSEASYRFVTPENSPFMTELRASDVDGDSITFIAMSGFGVEFQLDTFTGEISTLPNVVLDFESQRSYLLVVGASDGVFMTLVNVSIAVQDVNDLPPVFSQDTYRADILESLPLGASVVQVVARDEDTSSNAIIQYSLQQQGPFSINETTGIIFTSGALDFDSDPVIYLLNVTARNPLPPQFEDNAVVIINILDVNDLRPTITLNQPNFTFTENSSPLFIASNIEIQDGDGPGHLLTRCSATLTRSCAVGGITPCAESIFVNETLADQFGISLQNNETSMEHTLSIVGNTSEVFYQSLLQSLQYSNTAPEPLAGPRSISIQCYDINFPSNIVSISVLVTLRNEFCPRITATVSTLNFTEGSADLEVGRLAQFIFTDQDSAPHNTLQSLRIILNNRLDSAMESISILNSSGLMIMSSDTTDNTGGSGLDLLTQTIGLRSTGAPEPIATFARALQSLVYSNRQPEPNSTPRQISVIPMDPAQGCAPVIMTIYILLVNDNPPDLVLTSSPTIQYIENSGALAFAMEAGLMIVDLDHNSLFPMQSSTVILDGIMDGNNELLQYNMSALPVGVIVETSQGGK